MTYDRNRTQVSDYKVAMANAENIIVGQAFAFLSENFFKSPSMSWASTLFGKDSVKKKKILPLVGRNPIELPGLSISPLSIPKLNLQSVTSDKELYEAEKDIVNLLVLSILNKNSSIKLIVLLNGQSYSNHTLELDNEGAAHLILRDLPVGQFEVCFEEDDSDFNCKFTVAEYKLVPLVASIAEKKSIASDKLELKLKLTSFGKPVNDTIHGQVRVGEVAVDTFKGISRDGFLNITVSLQGEGPFSIMVQMESDVQKTASVPLTGTRKTEREMTLFSPLGIEVNGSLLPVEGAIQVKGIYLASGAHVTSPLSLERVDADTARLKMNSEGVSDLTILSLNLNSLPIENDPADIARMIHPSQNCNLYRKAESEFKSGNFKEALELFTEGKSEKSNPHPYYSYYIACCYARLKEENSALEALNKAIKEGWCEFDHMAGDSDLEILKEHPAFKAMVAEDYQIKNFDSPKAGETVEFKLDSGPLSILAIAAFIDGKPWEGWAAVLSPDKLTCKVSPPSKCEPGKRIEIEIDCNSNEVRRAYTIVKDARLLTGDNPSSRLATRMKNVVDSVSKTMDHGPVTKTMKEILEAPISKSDIILDLSAITGAQAMIPPPQSFGGGWQQAQEELEAGGDLSSGAWSAPQGPMPGSAGGTWAASSSSWGAPDDGPQAVYGRAGGSLPEQNIRRKQSTGGEISMAYKSLNSLGINPKQGRARETSYAIIDLEDVLETRSQPQVIHAGFIELKDGKGKIKLTLPDEFGDYLVETFILKDLEWYHQETRFTVIKDPFLSLITPVFARAEEKAEGTIYAGNGTGNRCTLTLTRDGQEIPLRLPDGSRFDGTVDTGQHHLKFECLPGKYKAKLLDPSNKTVESASKVVDEPGKIKTTVRSLRLLEAGESINLSDDVSMIRLTLLPGLDTSFDLLTEATINYEHCCCEQTAAKILAACSAYMLHSSKNGKGDADEKLKAESSIIAGITRMEKMWLKGKGFKSYPHTENVPNDYYGKAASRYLFNLESLRQISASIGPDLKSNLVKGLEMAKDTSAAYNFSWPPTEIQSCSDAYSVLVFGNGNGDSNKALNYVRGHLEQAESLKDYLASLPANPFCGAKVNARIQASYAAACLLRSGQPNDKRNALELTNTVISEFNESGRLYSTMDSTAAVALMTELMAAKVTGGGEVEIDGARISVAEAFDFPGTINSIKVLEGIAAVECQKEVIEDWNQYASTVKARIGLSKNGQIKQAFATGDTIELEVSLEEEYQDGDLLWVCLPDSLSRVTGGGQVKLFSMDFKGKSKLSIPLAATGRTGNNGKEPQKFAVCVRNMFNEDRVGSPGLMEVRVE